MDNKLKTALKQSFTPPPAQYLEQFTNSVCYPKATFREVLTSQIAFIRKRVWCSFVLSICFAFFYTQIAGVPENILAAVSAILPLFSLCTITEICKSAAYNMEEMELACKYNLPKITLMRLGILGTVTFMVLVLLVIIAEKSNFGTLRNTIYIGVPYLISNDLSLLIISKFRSRETIYVCAAISGAVSSFIIIAGSSIKLIYTVEFTFIWAALFTIFAGFLIYGYIRFAKSQEELQWSLS